MAKSSSIYVCNSCGNEFGKWMGKCPICGEWNTLVETTLGTSSTKKGTSKSVIKPTPLASIKAKSTKRILTKIPELDSVLGGGLVPSQVVLIAGEPGIGKSTILLQVAENLGNSLYISGEESAGQIKIRAERLEVSKKSVQILESTDVDEIIATAEQMNRLTGELKSGKNSSTVDRLNSLAVIIVDSIQTLTTEDLNGMAGSPGQVRECSYRLVKLAKRTGIPIIIVGHVTKEGSVSGPAHLMHIVDTVLWFEGEKSLTHRILRAHKNRFGPTDEVGVFEMRDKGLISVTDVERAFLSDTKNNVSGSIVSSVMSGSRPILIEIQTLINPTKMVIPRRVAQGFDSKRLELILAILARRAGIPAVNSDVFLNILGGFSVREPSVDLAVALSLASSYKDKKLPNGVFAIGEVDLSGEIREVVGQERRIKEAKKLGFTHIVSSKNARNIREVVGKYIK